MSNEIQQLSRSSTHPDTLSLCTPFLSNSPEWEYIRMTDGRISEISSCCETVSGYSPSEFKANPGLLAQIVHPDDRFRYDKYVCAGYSADQIVKFKFRIIHKDGSHRSIDHICRPICDGEGIVIGAYAVNRDITELENLNRSLIATQNRLQDTLRLAGIGWWEYDCTADKLEWSDEVYRIFELVKGEFGGTYEAFQQYIHPEDLKAVKDAYSEAVAARKPYSCTHRICLPGGVKKTVREYARSVYDKNGIPIRSFGLIQDITTSEKQQIELNHTLQLLESFLNTTTDVVFLKDADLNYTHVNRTFAKLCDRNHENLVGCSDYDLFPAHSASKFQADDRRVMEERQTRNYVEQFESPDGLRYFQTAKGPLIIDDAIQGVFAIARDVTEQRQINQLLLRQKHALDQCPSAIVLAAADGVVEYVNPSYCTSSGQEASSILGNPISFLAEGPGYFYSDFVSIRNALARGEVWRGDLMECRTNGTVWWQRAVVAPVFGDDGLLSAYLMMSEDITAEKVLAEQVHYLSTHDATTNLPTLEKFAGSLQLSLRQSLAAKRRSVVAVTRFDYPELLTQKCGHSNIGSISIEIRDRIRKILPGNGLLGRIGDDGFVTWFESNESDTLSPTLLQQLSGVFDLPFAIDGQDVSILCCIGAAICPEHGEGVEELLEYASHAAWEARRLPDQPIVFYNESLTRAKQARVDMWRSLRNGIDRGELTLFYQPRVDVATGVVMGIEALARWHSPEHGDIPPHVFIKLAEETGLIDALADRILRMACSQAKEWLNRGLLKVPVAVNLSAVEFRKPDVSENILAIMKEFELPATFLEIEVTETTAMWSIPETVTKLAVLREHGIRVALDDFGTGFASLSHLHELAFDYLKIDQSFVARISATASPKDKAIVRSIIELGKAFSFELIAEGVETVFQRDFLLHNDCHCAQGYLFCHPLPADSITNILEDDLPLPAVHALDSGDLSGCPPL